ncbi:unnamed protein product [Anisakis simplex]|uniref:Col_cuticle_N domain-containing protein n=1 Tax=Anisakis simplex TaxID=6269 RepID=A0A0M3J7M1_ANISI|nr:unnamed protein product [Anisakis simplex]
MAVSVFATLLGLFIIAGIVEGDDRSFMMELTLNSLTARVNNIEQRLDKTAEQLRMFEDNLRVVRAERCQNCLQGPVCPIGTPGRQGMPGMPGTAIHPLFVHELQLIA